MILLVFKDNSFIYNVLEKHNHAKNGKEVIRKMLYKSQYNITIV